MIESGQSNPEAQKEDWKKFIESGAASIAKDVPGRENQDRFLSSRENMSFAVIDGMGGHVHGEVAAQTALSALKAYVWPKAPRHEQALKEMEEALLQANDQVLFLGEKQEYRPKLSEEKNPMGAAVAAVKLFGDGQRTMAAIGHVGDCRVYKLNRKGQLEHLTLDDGYIRAHMPHSQERALLAQAAMSNITQEDALGDFGKAVNAPENRNAVSQHLGKEEIQPHVQIVEVFPGESLLLASDGLSNLRGGEIEHILLRQGSAESKAQNLVQAAASASQEKHFWAHEDDITAVVVENKAN